MSIGLFVLVLVIQRCCCCWGSGNLDAPSSHQLLEEEHTCEPVGRAGGLSCEAEAEAAESDSSFYAASLALTRSRVQLRDTDVVIATYPKSGTHWVVAATSFLLSNQTRAPLATALNKHHQRYGDDPEHIVRFFHHYPVFMLLPDSRREPVPNSTFELVESIPDGVPRIFVTHQSASELEYHLAPRTKVLYLFREPRAVLHSIFKYQRSLIEHDENFIKAKETQNVQPVSFAEVTADFMGMRLAALHPARMQDDRPNAQPYLWAKHVKEWYRLGRSRQTTGTFKMLDFHEDVLASPSAVQETARRLAEFLLGKDLATPGVAQQTVQAASLQAIQKEMMLVDRENDEVVEHHFHAASATSWKEMFQTLSPIMRTQFERLHSATYKQMLRLRKSTHEKASLEHPAPSSQQLQRTAKKKPSLWL